MTRLIWDDDPRMFSGVDHGVIYGSTGGAVAWNGLLAVNDTSSDSGVTAAYQDGEKYLQTRPYTIFSGSIEALTSPSQVDGVFDLSYRVMKTTGYELHLVYNASAVLTSAGYSSLGAEQNITHFNWDISTLPVLLDINKATSHIVIDVENAWPEVMTVLNDILYGTSSTDPRIPDPQELVNIFETNAQFRIIDNGDGTWTAIGPNDWIMMLDSTTFEITSPSAIFIDANSYTISSW